MRAHWHGVEILTHGFWILWELLGGMQRGMYLHYMDLSGTSKHP